MSYSRIKSYAKINLALNVTGKTSELHKIESIISFIDLYDVISIKKTGDKKHNISFQGKFAKGIGKKKYCSKTLSNIRSRKIVNKSKI